MIIQQFRFLIVVTVDDYISANQVVSSILKSTNIIVPNICNTTIFGKGTWVTNIKQQQQKRILEIGQGKL